MPKLSLRHRASQGGYAIALALFLILALAGGITTYLLLSTSQARKSAKSSVQTAGGALLENQMASLHGNARAQLEATATLDLSAWAGQVGTQPGTDPNYTTAAAIANGQGTVTASQSLGSLGAYPNGQLTQADDPFRGARADVTSTVLAAKATRTQANPYGAGTGQGQSDAPLNVAYNATVDFRRMPVSQWTYFSQGGATLSAGEFPQGNAGRAYVAKDAGISGTVATSYPFAAGGNIFMDVSQADSQLVARSGPDDSATFTLKSNTTEATWPEYARSIAGSRVLSGRDIPLGLIRPASAGDLTARPDMDLGSDARNAQKLALQCERTVWLRSVDAQGKGVFKVSGNQNGSVALRVEAAQYSIYNSPSHPAGPLIVFDYAAQPQGLHPSYYFYSDVPGAALLVRHARVLQGPLSLVTPLDIYVEDGLGDLAADGTAITQPTVPVSLATGNARVFGVKAGW